MTGGGYPAGMSGPEVVSRVAVALSRRLGVPLVGGRLLRVKSTPTHHIDLGQYAFTWRLMTTPVRPRVFAAGTYDRGWCFTGRNAFALAYSQAVVWPVGDGVGHVPDYWYKTAYGGTDVRREEHDYG